jgi:hypothetical protein
VHSFRGKRPRHALTNATCTARDDGNFSFEVLHCVSPCWGGLGVCAVRRMCVYRAIHNAQICAARVLDIVEDVSHRRRQLVKLK